MNSTERLKVLVVGAAGGFGGAVAKELLSRGHVVRAGGRPGGRPVELKGAELCAVDALDRASLSAAARGAEVIVYAFNLPYEQWDPAAVDAARIVADVAAESGALIVLPGNVYGLGPDFRTPLAEDAPRDCPSHKGRLRNELEEVLRAATERGARVLIVRAGDFFGPSSQRTSWFNFMTRRALHGGAVWSPAPPNVPHAWAYLPDLAEATVQLIERRDELSPCEVFHFAGHAVDGQTLLRAVVEALGEPRRRVRNVPWWLLRVAGLASRMLREVLEMRYLWNEPVLLDDRKLRAFLGRVPHTPLQQAVRETLVAHGFRQAARLAPPLPV